MKFSQLPIGQPFRFQGKTYSKVSPLMAQAEGESAQRLIPRSAEVEPLGELPQRSEPPQQLPRQQVDRAMQALAEQINAAVAESGLPAEGVNALLRQLQSAMLECRRTLEL